MVSPPASLATLRQELVALEESTPGPMPLAPREALRGDVFAAMPPQWFRLLTIKAPLVCLMMERIVTPEHMRHTLQLIVGEAQSLAAPQERGQVPSVPLISRSVSTLSAMGDQVSTPHSLGTYTFVEFLRVVGGADAHELQQSFVERWIYGAWAQGSRRGSLRRRLRRDA